MSLFSAEVVVDLKPLVNDPQGLTVRDGLRSLGFAEVRSARVGKVIRLELDADSEPAARAAATAMCERLLCNPVIEDYAIESLSAIEPAAHA